MLMAWNKNEVLQVEDDIFCFYNVSGQAVVVVWSTFFPLKVYRLNVTVFSL